jgi:membrane-associated protease RseP (regulator of RpoE activity)
MLQLVVGALVILYIGCIAYLRYNPQYLPDWMSIWGGIFLLIHSEKGLNTIHNLSKHQTFWRYWGNSGVLFAISVMIAAFAFTAISAGNMILTGAESAISKPQNYLVIPGVNDFLPLTIAVELLLALGFAMIIHEAGHAIYCKVEGIEIESTGLVFLGLLPFGAFVEPDEESQNEASRVSRLRMASAGVFNNTVLGVLASVLFVGLVILLLAPVNGAYIGGVAPSSPADTAGLEKGNTVTQINGEDIHSNQDLQEYLVESEDHSVTVQTNSGQTVTVDRNLKIQRVLDNSDLTLNETITSVNGDTIQTRGEFNKILETTELNNITIETESGTTVSYPTGALFIASEELSVSGHRIAEGDQVRVISRNESIIHQSSDVESISEDDTLTVVHNDEELTIENTQQFQSNTVSVSGVNGLEVSDFGASLYPADQFYQILSGDSLTDRSLFTWSLLMLLLPLATLVGFSHNFSGFTSDVSGFYTFAGPEITEPLFLFALTFLYWTAWINFNVAVFNCIPTFALDGGHIIRDSVAELWSQFGFDINSEIPQYISGVVLIVTAALLGTIIFSPLLP